MFLPELDQGYVPPWLAQRPLVPQGEPCPDWLLNPCSLFQGLGRGGDHKPGELLLQAKETQHDLVQPRIGDKGKSRSEKVFQARLKALCGTGQRAAMHRHDPDHHPLVQRPRQLQHRHHQL